MFKYLCFLVFSISLSATAFAQAKNNTAKAKKSDTIRIQSSSAMDNPAKNAAVAGANQLHTSIQKTTRFVSVKTDSGTMVIRLYDSTPLHTNNFIKLVSEGFYDSLLFHRVIPGFMIQGGDPNSKVALPGARLGDGGDNLERIPAEFKVNYFHKKGALAAARDGNPEKKSSACQFYLVDGRTFTDEQLNAIEQKSGIRFTDEQRMIYKTIGGSPHLDGAYTVFGEVVEGIEVISKIAALPRDANNRPLQDVRMQMKLIENYPVK